MEPQRALRSSTFGSSSKTAYPAALPPVSLNGSRCHSRTLQTRKQALVTERELEIKLAIAQSTDRLDLSECQLSEIPANVFDLHNLRELSLAGNQLQHVPAAVAQLSSLQRLVLAGNLLTELPVELFSLTALEGLWVHGNLLESLPEQLGSLQHLKQLSFAGNCLSQVPDSLTQLVHLQDLNLSGNKLCRVPDGIGALTALQKLSLHGNQLQQVPADGWQYLQQLDEVCLQGNQLSTVPDSLAKLGALTELSLADNRIQQLPADLSGLTSLRKAHLYGNQFTDLPMGPEGLPSLLLPSRQVAPGSNDTGSSASSSSSSGGGAGSCNGSRSGPVLSSLWLEANPLSQDAVAQLLELAADAVRARQGHNGPTDEAQKQPRIGLDDCQLSGSNLLTWQQQQQQGCTIIKRGIIKGSGPGYFKLQLGETASQAGASSSNSTPEDGRVLVVAFGSAPGLPNWGGILAKVWAAAEKPEEQCFDVLYVVDPFRNWYCGGDADLLQQQYTSRLQMYTEQYRHVVMMGDSMGASAALLFSPLATNVLSFCPQVDLSTSSIRPGRPASWHADLQETLQAAVAQSTARIAVYTGTWQHDVDQAHLLEHHPHVKHKVHSFDSHRLALALAAQNKLAPIIREAILSEVGLASGNVRLSNLL